MSKAVLAAVFASVLIFPATVVAFPDAGVVPPDPTTLLTNDHIVGFHALPDDRSQYAGQPIVGVNEDIAFFVVEVVNPVTFFASVSVDENVRYYEADVEVQALALVPNDTYYNQYQWDMKPATTNMEAAWNLGFGTTSTKICIGDTGQNRAHQDLNGLTYYYWKDVVGGKTAAYDDNGHGSHTVGTVAAETNNAQGVAGIASGASIGGVKLMNNQGGATISQLANGITECKNSGGHIQSHSWGVFSDYTAIRDATNAALAAGQMMVVATGNEGPCSNCLRWPARYAGVTAIGSTGTSNQQSSFSSEGPEIDFAAPGENILSTWTKKYPCNPSNGNTCYVFSSGTSMATPHVAGLAGLVKSAHPTYTSQQIYDAIKAAALDVGAAGFDQETGWGLIRGTAV